MAPRCWPPRRRFGNVSGRRSGRVGCPEPAPGASAPGETPHPPTSRTALRPPTIRRPATPWTRRPPTRRGPHRPWSPVNLRGRRILAVVNSWMPVTRASRVRTPDELRILRPLAGGRRSLARRDHGLSAALVADRPIHTVAEGSWGSIRDLTDAGVAALIAADGPHARTLARRPRRASEAAGGGLAGVQRPAGAGSAASRLVSLVVRQRMSSSSHSATVVRV